MHTIILATKRKPDVSLSEFIRHYHDVHAPLAQRLPGLLEYRQMLIRHEGPRSDEAIDYDAVSIYVFKDDESAEAAWKSPEGVLLEEDTGKFIDWPSVLAMPVGPAKIHRPA